MKLTVGRRKLAIALFLCGLLGAQAYVMVFERGTGWYWPFMDYPMYGAAHVPGDSFVRDELRLTACDAPGAPRTVTLHELNVMPWSFRRLLSRCRGAAGSAKPPEQAIVGLSRAIRRVLPEAICSAEVRSRTFTIGSEGLVDAEPPWVTGCAWNPSETH